jgi:hypothetical protein
MAVQPQPQYKLAPLRTTMFDGPAAQPAAVQPAAPAQTVSQTWQRYFRDLHQHLRSLSAILRSPAQAPAPPLESSLLDTTGTLNALARSAPGSSQLGNMTMPWVEYFQNTGQGIQPIIGFIMNSGATGTDVGPILPAPRMGTASNLFVVVKASDPSTELTFTILQNQVAVITASVAAGTAAFTLVTFDSFLNQPASDPLSINQNDLFSINITSGSSAWVFTAVLGTLGQTSQIS